MSDEMTRQTIPPEECALDLNAVFEHIALAVLVECEGVIVLLNRAFENLFGVSREELVGQSSRCFRKKIDDGTSDFFLDSQSRALSLKNKQGVSFWATIETGTFRMGNDRKAIVWTITDVSRQKKAETRLRQMSLAVEQSSNSVVITDTSGLIQYVNSAFVATTGYTAQEAIGKTPAVLKSGRTPEHLYKEMWETITRGCEWSGQFINKKKNGEIYEEHVIVAPIRDERGRITHFIATKENITELKRARNQAQRASKAKGEFLAYMSHEIRTPLNVIIGMSALALETDLDPDQSRFIRRVKTSADHLLSIVNDILDYSKIEAGMLTIENRPFDLADLLSDIRDLLSFLAEQKGIDLDVSLTGGPDSPLNGDRLRLHQVLFNLVSNGIKFTEEGKVKLEVDVRRVEGSDDHEVRFQVSDTGIGIRPESLKVIFDSFVQADAAVTRNFGGTGLGLSICNQLVGLMGGELKVQSVPGLGSRFSFELLLRRSEDPVDDKPTRVEPGAGKGESLRVLLVEDNRGNQELATVLVEGASHTVTVADNGLDGLEQLAAGENFDVVLMDVQMPVLDGLTATKCIRLAESGQKTGVRQCEHLDDGLITHLKGGRLHIVAMTANVMLSDKERCHEAGVDDFLAKPYSKDSILAALRAGKDTAEETNHDGVPNSQGAPGSDARGCSYGTSLAHLRNSFSLDEERAARVLSSFVTSLRESLEQLMDAISEDDREAVRRLAHKMKGGLANIHCLRLAEVARELETAASEKDREEVSSLATVLGKGLETFCKEIPEG